MGVLYRFHLVLGVPADGLRDDEGRSLLERARANAAKEYDDEGDQDLRGHLDDLLPAPLRVFEGGDWSYGGERILVAGKELLQLEEAKGFVAWDVAGPLDLPTVEVARREVAEALAKVRGAGEPRLILLGMTF